MKLNEVFPSKYVKADDLKGREVPVVIAGVAMEKLGDDSKLVLHFQGKDKGMVCNKTNASRIAYLYGDDTDEWIGREILLVSEFVEFQGKTVQGLRVKPPAKRAATNNTGNNMTSHTAVDRGIYDVMERRKTEPVQNTGQGVPDDGIPF